MEDWNDVFSRNIERLRKYYGLKIEEEAKFLSIPKSNIYDYECGKYIPSVENAVKISKFFNVSLSALFFNVQKESITANSDLDCFKKLLYTGSIVRVDSSAESLVFVSNNNVLATFTNSFFSTCTNSILNNKKMLIKELDQINPLSNCKLDIYPCCDSPLIEFCRYVFMIEVDNHSVSKPILKPKTYLIAERIKLEMQKQNKTIEDMEEILGLGETNTLSVTNIINGKTNPKLNTLLNYVDELDMDLDKFLYNIYDQKYLNQREINNCLLQLMYEKKAMAAINDVVKSDCCGALMTIQVTDKKLINYYLKLEEKGILKKLYASGDADGSLWDEF